MGMPWLARNEADSILSCSHVLPNLATSSGERERCDATCLNSAAKATKVDRLAAHYRIRVPMNSSEILQTVEFNLLLLALCARPELTAPRANACHFALCVMFEGVMDELLQVPLKAS